MAIARSSKGRAFVTTRDVESAYRIACEERDEKARAHTAFWGLMKDLDTLGVVSAKKSGPGISGKTTVIKLLDVPAKVLEQKITQMLDDEL